MKKEPLKDSNKILDKVSSFISVNKIYDIEKPIIVGFSGGADSMALLDILISLGYNCIAAHCNFKLRGDESVRDHEFVKIISLNYGIKFEEIEFNTKQYAHEKGISIEMAARELRYEWFGKIMNETNAQSIAIAHHIDDTIETFFLNLLRGTGIAGLSGINTINKKISRPLNCLTQEEIYSYIKSKDLDYVTDSTNLEDIYLRNKIRLQLMPLLEDINPSAKESICKTIGNLKDTEIIYKNSLEGIKKNIIKIINDEIHIPIIKIKDSIAPKTILFEILRDYGVQSNMINSIYNSLDSISGKFFLTDDYKIIKDRNDLIIIRKESNNDLVDSEMVVNEGDKCVLDMNFDIIDKSIDFTIPLNKHIGCFDAEKIKFPLIIRKWKQGDKFIPFGMNNYKKISDYFSDNKFSLADKNKTLLLCSGNNIIWIIGERIDNRYRIDIQTKKILTVSINENKSI